MAFVFRWWQSLLHALSLGGSGKDDGWVEPGNEITRAVLSGAVMGLSRFQNETIEVSAIAVAAALVPTEPDLPIVEHLSGVEVEALAAEQQREAQTIRPRKRRGHRAA